MTEPTGPALPALPRVGVLVLRVEVEAGHLLITVTVNRNVNRVLYSARPDGPLRTADQQAALNATAAFLRSFEVD